MQISRTSLVVILLGATLLTGCQSTVAYYKKVRDFAGEQIDRCFDSMLQCESANKGKGYCESKTPNYEPLAEGKPCFVVKMGREVAKAGNAAQQDMQTRFSSEKDQKALEKAPLNPVEYNKIESEPNFEPGPVILKPIEQEKKVEPVKLEEAPVAIAPEKAVKKSTKKKTKKSSKKKKAASKKKSSKATKKPVKKKAEAAPVVTTPVETAPVVAVPVPVVKETTTTTTTVTKEAEVKKDAPIAGGQEAPTAMPADIDAIGKQAPKEEAPVAEEKNKLVGDPITIEPAKPAAPTVVEPKPAP